MKTSIAMATYNGAKYLQSQLDSFAKQSCVPDELVVCDDCSSDATVEILNQFSRVAPFNVRHFVNASQLGYIRNFDRVLSLCEGDLIFPSDQDDVWFDTKLKEILRYMQANPRAVAVTHDQIITDANLVPAGSLMVNIRRGGLSKWDMMHGCCSAIKREWLDIALPIDPSLEIAHDTWICRLADYVGLRSIYDVPLQYYRRHDCSMTRHMALKGQLTKRRVLSEKLRYGLADARTGWGKERERLVAFYKRLDQKAQRIDALGFRECRLDALKKITTEHQMLERRMALLSERRWGRLNAVLSFWKGGGYGYFEGWKSAVKDLIR
jgi:glycosyltransferase involved in cell wall biosynthesis